MKFIILGCGSSMGVPRADGFFGKCNPNNKKNYRSRCSALLKLNDMNILIDTSPELRTQLINNDIKKIDKVLYSHMHADQTHGINDLRIFYMKSQKKIQVYADKDTSKYLKKTFSYCFKNISKEYPAILSLNSVKKVLNFKKKKQKVNIRSIKVKHGSVNSICYIFNKSLAYISDVSMIDKKDFKFFRNLKYLIIDCLWYETHPSHLGFKESLKLIKEFSPKKAILTNMHNNLDYNELKAQLPKNIIPAYDGLTINL